MVRERIHGKDARASEVDMGDDIDLQHGFLVGILQDPGGSLALRTLLEAEQVVRQEGALLRSGPAVNLTEDEQQTLGDGACVLAIVAVDLYTEKIIGHASVHLITTFAGGAKLHIEDVVTHPDYERRGVGKAVMTVALQEGQQRWRARKATLTSNASRVAARSLYTALGFESYDTTFTLTFGEGSWRPPGEVQPRHWWDGVDRDSAHWRRKGVVQDAVVRICSGIPRRNADRPIVRLVNVYKYKDAP